MKVPKLTLILIFCTLIMMIVAVIWLRPVPPESHHKPDLTHVFQNDALQIYFSQEKGSDIVLVPVKRKPPSTLNKSFKAMVGYAMKELLEGPTAQERASGYFSEIPAGTKLLSVTETTKGIYIDLSQEYTAGGGSNSMVQRLQAVAKTMLALPQRKPVYLTVVGKSLETLGGEGLVIHQPITSDPSIVQ